METPLVTTGSAARSRESEVIELVNAIVDPCSAATGVPIGLIDMGITSVRSIDAGQVNILISPTFPGCRFAPIFEAEIRERLLRLEWCKEVHIAYSDPTDVWTEDRMSEDARARMKAHRAEVRRRAIRSSAQRELPLIEGH